MRRTGNKVLLLAALLPPALYLWLAEPLPQDPAYHLFADARAWLGISNFANVISNLPLALIGALGLRAVWRGASGAHQRLAQGVLFSGALLTAAGSAAYHWLPCNATLVLDRAPMTLMFMALLSMLIGERVSARAGALLLTPLCAVGLLSVGWWALHDDLRWYAVVHYYSLALMVLMLWRAPSAHTGTRYYWFALAWYALAKLCEAGDAWLLGLLGLVSGHSLKHLFAAAAIWSLLRMLRHRSVTAPLQAASTTARVRKART